MQGRNERQGWWVPQGRGTSGFQCLEARKHLGQPVWGTGSHPAFSCADIKCKTEKRSEQLGAKVTSPGGTNCRSWPQATPGWFSKILLSKFSSPKNKATQQQVPPRPHTRESALRISPHQLPKGFRKPQKCLQAGSSHQLLCDFSKLLTLLSLSRSLFCLIHL